MPWTEDGDGRIIKAYRPWGCPFGAYLIEETSDGGVKIGGISDMEIKKAPSDKSLGASIFFCA